MLLIADDEILYMRDCIVVEVELFQVGAPIRREGDVGDVVLAEAEALFRLVSILSTLASCRWASDIWDGKGSITSTLGNLSSLKCLIDSIRQ